MKKLILVVIVVVFFYGFKLASAEVIINEVAWMGTSNSANDEWIELKNTGSSSVDLSGWILVADDGTPNIILSDKCTNLNINANSFLLLERTSDDTVSGILADCIYTGALLDGGETLILKDGNRTEINKVEASSGWLAGDKDTKETMQWNGTSWITATSTPKEQNSSSGNNENNSESGTGTGTETETETETGTGTGDEGDSDTDTDSSTGSSSSSGSAEKEKVIINPTIKAKILAKTIAFVGLPLDIENGVLGYSNENIRVGRYFWNFGDGDSLETISSEKFSHTYYYPGEYTITLDYYLRTSFLTGVPDAINKITVKVLPLTVSISNVGDEKDFFVELTNNSDYDVDISKWILSSSSRSFIFPRNSSIPAKNKITLSPKITYLIIASKKDLKLITSAGDIAFDYNLSSEPIVITKKVSTSVPTKSSVENSNLTENTATSTPEVQIPIPVSSENLLENIPENLSLSASIISANQNTGDFKYSYLLWIGLIFFLGVGASAVYFLRRGRNNGSAQIGSNNRNNSNVGNDFGVLDE